MKKLSKREKTLIIIAILSMAFLFSNFFLITPYINKLTDLQDEKARLTDNKQEMSIALNMKKEYEESYESIKSQYQEINSKIMDNKLFDEIDEILSAEFAKHNVPILQFEIEEKVLEEDVDEEEKEEIVSSNLKTVSVVINARGEKQNIYNLIDDFSDNSKVDIIDFIISDQGQEQLNQLIISFEYVMYR